MFGASGNLAYWARGTRTYGLRPVLGRARGFWELQWIIAGGARPERDEAGFAPGAPPCLYVSHPDSSHGWTDDGAGESEVFVLHFRSVPPELAARVAPARTLVVKLAAAERRAALVRLEEAWALAGAGDARLGLKLDQVLVETALLVLGRSAPAAPADLPADRVERVLHWVEENLGENPSVDDMARAAGVSSAHLRRLFAEAGRPAPRAELARLKMEAARRCLLAGWKLERVAEYLGFSEASAFSRAFSAASGCSPRVWRARERSL